MAKKKNYNKKGNQAGQAAKMQEETRFQPANSRKYTADEPDVLKWLTFILLALFAAFLPALGNDFVNWDDHAYISENAIIKSLAWSNIKYIFTPTTYVVGNYHPLTVLSYCLEYALVELKPFLYHFDNILLHAINTVLVFLVVRKLLGRALPGLLVAALFAVHPLRVESVAWAAERKDVLYTLFFMISLYLYQFYTEGNKYKNKWYILSILFFLLSILSKGQAVVLPITFILIDYFKQRKFDKRAVLEKIPYFILALFFGVIAMKAQHTSLTTERLASHSFLERIMFASYGLVMYLYKFILPINLSCFYAYPFKTGGTYPLMIYLSPFIVLTLLILVWVKYRNNRPVLFGVLFFLGTIFIVLQFLPVGEAIMADRYTYIPLLGLFFIVVYLLEGLFKRYREKQKIIFYSFGAYILLLTGVSFARTLEWKNSTILWTSTINRYPNTAVAYNDRGVEVLNRGSLDSAYKDLTRAIALKPDYFEAHSNLGNYYGRLQKHDLELECYNTALKYNSIHTGSLFNRGLCYCNIQQYELSAKDFQRLLELEPNNASAYYSLGMTYKKWNNRDSLAIVAYSKAIEFNPKYDDAFNNRANIYYNHKDYDKAIADYNSAIATNPNNANARFNRSAAYAGKKEWAKAWEDMQQAGKLGYNVDAGYIDMLKNNMNAPQK